MVANTPSMKFDSLIPILYSADISRSITYYMDKLAFTTHRVWDDEKTFGGISSDCVEIFFCKDGQGNPGTWLVVNVDDVDTDYETIKIRCTNILSAPDNKTMEPAGNAGAGP